MKNIYKKLYTFFILLTICACTKDDLKVLKTTHHTSDLEELCFYDSTKVQYHNIRDNVLRTCYLDRAVYFDELEITTDVDWIKIVDNLDNQTKRIQFRVDKYTGERRSGKILIKAGNNTLTVNVLQKKPIKDVYQELKQAMDYQSWERSQYFSDFNNSNYLMLYVNSEKDKRTPDYKDAVYSFKTDEYIHQTFYLQDVINILQEFDELKYIRITNQKYYWTLEPPSDINDQWTNCKGYIPESIGNFKNLIYFGLQCTDCDTELPLELFSDHIIEIRVDGRGMGGKDQNIHGEIKKEWFLNAKKLEKLELGHTKITGTIPEEIKYSESLYYFNVAGIGLSPSTLDGDNLIPLIENAKRVNGLLGIQIENSCKSTLLYNWENFVETYKEYNRGSIEFDTVDKWYYGYCKDYSWSRYCGD